MMWKTRQQPINVWLNSHCSSQKKSLDDKLVLCQSVETKLTGNANVPTPAPTIANLTTKRLAIVAKRNDLATARETVIQYQNDLANLETDLDNLLTTEAA